MKIEKKKGEYKSFETKMNTVAEFKFGTDERSYYNITIVIKKKKKNGIVPTYHNKLQSPQVRL